MGYWFLTKYFLSRKIKNTFFLPIIYRPKSPPKLSGELEECLMILLSPASTLGKYLEFPKYADYRLAPLRGSLFRNYKIIYNMNKIFSFV